MALSVLEEPRTFAPKKFFLVIWLCTLVLAGLGMYVADWFSVPFWIWMIVAATCVRQIWVTRWVQVDTEGIRVRNILGRGRELLWDSITEVDDRVIPIRKENGFTVMKLSGEMQQRPGRVTTITVDSDIAGFDALRKIIMSAVPAAQQTV